MITTKNYFAEASKIVEDAYSNLPERPIDRLKYIVEKKISDVMVNKRKYDSESKPFWRENGRLDAYKKILEEIEKGTFFKRDKEVEWVCLECGYVHYDTEPPEKCPSCGHPKSYYVARDLLSL